MQKSKPDEIDVLLERIRQGSKTEREEALQYLLQEAQASQDAEQWNHFALGLQAAGRFEEAMKIFNQLVAAFPERDIYRLSLATCYSQTGQFEMCRYHLRYVAEHGSSEEARKLGREQLEGLEHFLKQTEQDSQLRQLQIDGLRERIASSQASANEYEKLARILLQAEQQGTESISLNEITVLLEEGQKRFPKAVTILELLALCYTRNDPMNRLESVLKQLEKEAPDSKVLQVFSNIDDTAIEAYQGQMSDRTQELLMKVQSKDPALRAAAVQDLRKIVDMFPSNLEYRLTYAFALSMAGKCPEALRQGELLANEMGNSHNAHFNLGQIFWLCGDAVRGKHHLDLSLKFARTDEERRDAMERIADLSGR